MDIDARLYVEIVPVEGGRGPVPHPVDQAGFDPSRVYKVLGMYNASETSECYLVLANPKRELWFISNRHVRAWGLRDGDELSLPREDANRETPTALRRGLPEALQLDGQGGE